MRKKGFLWVVVVAFASIVNAKDYNVTDFGAIGDGKTKNTVYIQQAVDRCAAEGGGRVVVPSGVYVTGTIFLRSHVNLHLEQNAELSGSKDLNDYPDLAQDRKGVVHAANIEDASITGFGTINANGCDLVFQSGDSAPLRPHVVIFKNCRRMHIQDVTLRNAADWTFRIWDCDEVFVRGIRVYSHCNFNNDGIDIDARNVVVSDCMIESTDDGICFKSNHKENLCENVTVTNCVIASNCNAIKFGTASLSGFKNITVSNCVIKTPAENDLFGYKAHMVPGVTAPVNNNSGISIEMVDAGLLEKISITNITMQDVLTPIFIRLGARRPRPVKYLKDIVISNIIANGESLMTSSITGIPGYYAENIKISNVIFNCPGGGLADHVKREIPEKEKTYPENKMFGPNLPAYGFFVRHARNVTLENVRFNLRYKDVRHAFWLEDAFNVKVLNLESDDHTSDEALVYVKNSNNVTVSGYSSPNVLPLFLKTEGKDNSRIKLMMNDFSTVKKVVDLSPEVEKGKVIMMSNIEK